MSAGLPDPLGVETGVTSGGLGGDDLRTKVTDLPSRTSRVVKPAHEGRWPDQNAWWSYAEAGSPPTRVSSSSQPSVTSVSTEVSRARSGAQFAMTAVWPTGPTESCVLQTGAAEPGSNPVVKFKPYSRREHRRLLRRWVGENRSRVAILVLAALALIAFETALLLVATPPAPWRWYLLGVVHAGILAAAAGLLLSAFHAHEVAAINQVRGAWGEDNTRDELRRARRKRLIWGWVDSISVSTGDIDHLVVTRRGGLVAIDSKWRSSLHDVEGMVADARRMRVRAQGVLGDPLRTERGQHRSHGRAHQVTSLVVVWGPAQRAVPDAHPAVDVDLVPGRDLVSWLRRAGGDQIDRVAARDLVHELERYRESRWEAAMTREAKR